MIAIKMKFDLLIFLKLPWIRLYNIQFISQWTLLIVSLTFLLTSNLINAMALYTNPNLSAKTKIPNNALWPKKA